ncbi:MAG: phosphate/phosphite/phosphonate ABC transporter substrate-binding protein [Candidatus Methylomirabilales bacterium]
MDLRWISKVVERIPLLVGCLLVLTLIASCGRDEEPLPLDLKSSPILTADRPGSDGVMRFAVAPVISPEKSFASYKLFTKYLAAHLKTPVQLIQRKTYLEVNEMLRNGSVHFALVCTGAYIMGDREFGMDLVAVPRYLGKAEYHSFIIVREESPIRQIRDLEGKRIALSDPLSNSGYFYPMFLVNQMGRDPNRFFSQMLFTYSHDSSMQAVLEGIADVAAVDSLIFDYELDHNRALGRSLRIVHKSPPFGINPIVASRTTPKGRVEAVKQILLAMDQDAEGRRILDLLRIDDFIEPPPGMYEATRQMILQARGVEGSR